MTDNDRLELEQELLLTCSKSQAINKYIDELEENIILTNQWYKSQQEKRQLQDNWNKLKEWTKHERKVAVDMQNSYGIALCDCMINEMQELEKGSGNNE